MPGPAPGVLRGGTWKFVLTPGTSSPLNELYDVESTSSTSCVTVGDSLRVASLSTRHWWRQWPGHLAAHCEPEHRVATERALRLLVQLGGLVLRPSVNGRWDHPGPGGVDRDHSWLAFALRYGSNVANWGIFRF